MSTSGVNGRKLVEWGGGEQVVELGGKAVCGVKGRQDAKVMSSACECFSLCPTASRRLTIWSSLQKYCRIDPLKSTFHRLSHVLVVMRGG